MQLGKQILTRRGTDNHIPVLFKKHLQCKANCWMIVYKQNRNHTTPCPFGGLAYSIDLMGDILINSG